MSLPEIAGHELLDLIGSGRCGAVYRASAGGKSCAVKIFSSMAINRKSLSTAIQAMQQMPHHRGILAIEDYNFERSPYYLATPLVGVMTKDNQGRRQWHTPTLESVCNGIPAESAWSYIYQIADALAWLHKHGIPHGNLRPCNVLLEDDVESSIRLTDIAQGWVGGIHHLELTDHFVHLCPEQAENPDGVFAGYGPSWDVYSFGVLAYRLLTGKFPRAAQAWQQAPTRHAMSSLNDLLPEDIRIHEVTLAPPGFDARYSASFRRYRYLIADKLAPKNPLLARQTLWIKHELDLVQMQASALGLVGLHDYASFCRPKLGATTIREVRELTVKRNPAAGNVIEVEIMADAFCHNMVRAIVGALIASGEHKTTPDGVIKRLEKRSRIGSFKVQPPHGLTLIEVGYPSNDKLAEQAEMAKNLRTLDEN